MQWASHNFDHGIVGIGRDNIIRQHINIHRNILTNRDVSIVVCCHAVGHIRNKRHPVQGIVVAQAGITRKHIVDFNHCLGRVLAVPRQCPFMPIVIRRQLIHAAHIRPIDFQLQLCWLDLSINK